MLSSITKMAQQVRKENNVHSCVPTNGKNDYPENVTSNTNNTMDIVRIECGRCGRMFHSVAAFVNHADWCRPMYPPMSEPATFERRRPMMKPRVCWHLVHRKLTVQCGLDARRYIVRRPSVDDTTGSNAQTAGLCVMMWLCPIHVESVKKQGYVVALDHSTGV
jgi:hypothetical protein